MKKVAIALVAILLGLVMLPVAATPGLTAQTLHPRDLWPGSPAGIRGSTSENWSGYAVETSLTSPEDGVINSVAGTWTVPTVTSNGYSAVWVGIDGYSDNTVEQIGTMQYYSGRTANYYAWYEMYPSAMVQIVEPVTPGDHMSATVSWNGSVPNSFTLTLNDTSHSWTYSTTILAGSTDYQRQSAEWIVEAPAEEIG